MATTSIWTHREPNREAFLAWARKWHVSNLSEPEVDEQQPQAHLRYYHATDENGTQYRICEHLRDGSWGFTSQDTSSAYWNRMGRPSAGRSYRLQAAITPELASWLEEQKRGDDKSLSDVVFRLLEEARQRVL